MAVTQPLHSFERSFTRFVKIVTTKPHLQEHYVFARFKRIKLAGLAVIMAAAPVLAQDLTGAGATFPDPIYKKWFDAYATKAGVKINYQPIGSGGGVKQLTEQTVDFGGSDAPMTDE